MPIELTKEARERLLASIKRYALEELDADIGDLKATLFLDYVLEEMGPTIYNQAVMDVQKHWQVRLDDLGGEVYERESSYWKKQSRQG